MKKAVNHCLVVSLVLPFAFAVVMLSDGIFSVFAQENASPITLMVRAERETAIYENGENVTFHVRLLDGEKPLPGKELWYVIQGDGGFEKKGVVVSAETAAAIVTSLNQPGFLKCTVGWNDASGKTISAMGGAGVDPLKIRAQTPEPEDFDAFWNAKKKALDELPLEPILVPVPAEKVNNAAVQVFDIKVNCLGGKPVSGYFAKPVDAKPKSLPIVISYHGAGVRSAVMPIGDAVRNTLALDVNAHGIENGHPAAFYDELAKGELKDYRLANANDREKIYFVGMYLRVYRSLQFMKAQPEWDGKTIIVKGGSQGGGQALAAAGLDPQVTFCVAYVPAICYPIGDIESNFGGWPGFLRNQTKETADPAVVKTVPYIDAALFAKRIKSETILSTGFIDYVCSPTSVYVAYNNISAPKQMFPTPETNHAVPPTTSATVGKLLWDYVERNRIKAE